MNHKILCFFLALLLAMLAAACTPGRNSSLQELEAIDIADNDFIIEAQALYRLVACIDEDPFPGKISPDAVRKDCEQFKPQVREYLDNYVAPMKSFITRHTQVEPATRVIYPFSGGDLVTALMTFPDATEIYTISLEHAGDIRVGDRIVNPWHAQNELKKVRHVSAALLDTRDLPTATINTNGELIALQEGPFPGMITLFLLALAIYDQEPVSLRYFTIDDRGEIQYLASRDIQAMENNPARALSEHWKEPGFSAAFSNYELRFKPLGQAGPIRTHRHIAANLANSQFDQHSPLFKHLMRTGRFSAMTKGAQYLLWEDDFSNIRNYLLDRVDFMVSDCTGLSPLHALPAGFVYKTFGSFKGRIDARHRDNAHNQAFIDVFERLPYRKLPLQYGYSDREVNTNMIFLYRADN